MGQSLRVYPRDYGEIIAKTVAAQFIQGLSPQLRGKRYTPAPAGHQQGSIPVCTGKPAWHSRKSCNSWVYPRTHGETTSGYTRRFPYCGLSPYTRGNPLSYPRTFHFQGLSPYTRGNLRGKKMAMYCTGSIPVHTGKPTRELFDKIVHKVYPRTHGETQRTRQPKINGKGLSPYTRGNQPGRFRNRARIWSIPVHTGKPHKFYCRRLCGKVYPRTHGETSKGRSNCLTPQGLSPYTRGNPIDRDGKRR